MSCANSEEFISTVKQLEKKALELMKEDGSLTYIQAFIKAYEYFSCYAAKI